MSKPFETWLKTLGARRRDLLCDRGLQFTHFIKYPGNVTDWELTGAIKAWPDATAELTTFVIDVDGFADGFTTFKASLDPSQTAFASAPDSDGDGRVDLVYDFLLAEPDGANARRLFGGIFTVSGFVTEPA